MEALKEEINKKHDEKQLEDEKYNNCKQIFSFIKEIEQKIKIWKRNKINY